MTTLALEKGVTFENILLATDFSEASKEALEWAEAITELNEGQLFILHALPSEPHLQIPLDALPASTDRELSNAKLNLERIVSTESLGQAYHEAILKRGPVAEAVLDTIERKKIDLLVLGTHGRTGLKKVVIGSTAEELFRCAPCPVLTVGPSATRTGQIRRVLFATDFGPSSLQALPYAIDFANKAGGELILLHLVTPFPVDYVGPLWYPGDDVVEREKIVESQCMKQLRDLLPSNSDLKCGVKHRVEFHYAPEGIIDAARVRKADMIVIGVKRSGMNAPRLAAHMPWAIAHEVVCSARCPVLTVRA